MLHSNRPRTASHKASTAKMQQNHDPSAPPKIRPSAIPRSTSGTSNQRLEAMAASRSLHRPSQGTGQTIRHARVPSEDVPFFLETSLSRKEGLSRDNGSWSRSASQKESSKYPVTNGAIVGIVVPERRPVAPTQSPELPPQLIPELQALANHNRTCPSLPSISTISSPSTRFTESPAPWSASTATTTPVSMCSSSPAHVQTVPFKSMTIPQPHERPSRLPKLSAVHSGSNSQRPETLSLPLPDAEPMGDVSIRRKKVPQGSPPPSFHLPRAVSPPRRERIGSKTDRSTTKESLSNTGPPVTQVSLTLETSPLAKRSTTEADEIGSSSVNVGTSTTHAKLQNSIRAAPPRPSREGITGLGDSRPVMTREPRAGSSSNQRQPLAPAFEDAAPNKKAGSKGAEREANTVQKPSSKLSTLSRLGMFSRKSANTSSCVSSETGSNKLTRRGPAAGTGHEGYGKYAKRGRKLSKEGSSRGSDSEQSVSSVRSNPLRGLSRKNSTSSSRQTRPSQSELDEFAASRMKPVILRGGSEISVAMTDASVEPDRVSIGTSGEASSRFDSPPPREERKSGTFDQKPGLALRRSQRFGPGYPGVRIPRPIKTDQLQAPLYVKSQDTSLSSLAPSSVDSTQPAGAGAQLPAVKKKGRKHWWNPFQRSHQVSAPIASTVPPLTQYAEMAVSVESRPAPRQVPYYAVMESEGENNTNEAIGDYLAQAVVDSTAGSSGNGASDDDIPPMWKMRQSVLLPTTPNREEEEEEEEAKATSSQPVKTGEESRNRTHEATLKKSRLAQVGRIPKVVNRAEQALAPGRRSFSRPFRPVFAGEGLEEAVDNVNDAYTQPPRHEIAAAPAQPPGTDAGIEWYGSHAASAPTAYHKSDVSSSRSSSGMISVMGPPLIPLAGAVGAAGGAEMPTLLPSPRIALGLSGDDEVWNEYDDFLDDVMSPPRSKGQLAAGASNLPSGKGLLAPPDPRKGMLDLSYPPNASVEPDLSEEIRLRRSTIRAALQSHSPHDPSSPFSMREFIREYAGKGRDSTALSERVPSSSAPELVPLVVVASRDFVEEENRVQHTHDENADLLDSKERARNPGWQSELHYASLEVSRWLSFGRVLFSPAHEEIRMLPQRNVLVIDGLGNEDWSIYCAVTYEKEGAVIYNLKEDSSSSLSRRTQDSAHAPMNHHRRCVASLSERFPFHSAFFCAIVLRFPPVMSEAKMKRILAECRRVLEPGGHLEIMLLELDIVNMGVQTRRAVRELKMGMTDLAPDVDLRPTIDNFQAVLGGGGFTGLRRCIVGVPVTGRPAGSVESVSTTSSSRSSGGSISFTRQRSSGSVSRSRTRTSPTRKDHNFSLNDLVADHSEKADSKIGRLVSRTARSWWQHCYEADVLASRDQATSIFSDRRVMQECKARGSSFKLLIAHAQRPVFESRRRTMSEPVAPGRPTAGPRRAA